MLAFPCFIALGGLGARPRTHTVIVAVSTLLLGLAVARWTEGLLA